MATETEVRDEATALSGWLHRLTLTSQMMPEGSTQRRAQRVTSLYRATDALVGGTIERALREAHDNPARSLALLDVVQSYAERPEWPKMSRGESITEAEYAALWESLLRAQSMTGDVLPAATERRPAPIPEHITRSNAAPPPHRPANARRDSSGVGAGAALAGILLLGWAYYRKSR